MRFLPPRNAGYRDSMRVSSKIARLLVWSWLSAAGASCGGSSHATDLPDGGLPTGTAGAGGTSTGTAGGGAGQGSTGGAVALADLEAAQQKATCALSVRCALT